MAALDLNVSFANISEESENFWNKTLIDNATRYQLRAFSVISPSYTLDLPGLVKQLGEMMEVFKVFQVIMAVGGIALNLFAIIIIAVGIHIGEKIKISLINLAVADVLASVGLFAWLIGTTNIYVEACIHFIFSLALEASVLASLAISLERFVIISFPLRAGGYRKFHKLLVVGLIWLCAVPRGVVSIFNFIKENESNVEWSMIIAAAAMYTIVPTLGMVVANIAIFITLGLKKNVGERSSTQNANNYYIKVIQ